MPVQLRPSSIAVYCSRSAMLASERSLLARLILGALLQPALCVLLLFAPADTFAWWRAWCLIAVITIATASSVVALARGDRGLLEERLKPPIQRGQPGADKVVVLVFLVTLVAAILFVPVDVFRLHLLPPPPAPLGAAGLALVFASWWLILRAMHENAFAAPVVKHQAERRHRVVDSGPYAVVRHPMYAGVALFLVGQSLWLESLAGVVAASVPIAVLMIRIAIEERFLRRELPGYERYVTRVRARLIPGLW